MLGLPEALKGGMKKALHRAGVTSKTQDFKLSQSPVLSVPVINSVSEDCSGLHYN